MTFYRRCQQPVVMEQTRNVNCVNNATSVTLVTMETIDNKNKLPKSPSFSNEKSRRKKRKKGANKHAKKLRVIIPNHYHLKNQSPVSDNELPKGVDSKSKKLPTIPSSCRLDELACPTPRHQQVLPEKLACERRKKLPLLVAIKPENEKSEKERFMRANFNYNPFFLYRGAVDDDVMDKFRVPSDRYISQVSKMVAFCQKRFKRMFMFVEFKGKLFFRFYFIKFNILIYQI